MSIPRRATAESPARSTGPALFVGGWALAQLWLFWLAPLAGALLSGGGYRLLAEPRPDVTGVSGVVIAASLAVE